MHQHMRCFPSSSLDKNEKFRRGTNLQGEPIGEPRSQLRDVRIVERLDTFHGIQLTGKRKKKKEHIHGKETAQVEIDHRLEILRREHLNAMKREVKRHSP